MVEDVFEIRDDEINVEEIMRKIKENIAKRKIQDIYKEEKTKESTRFSNLWLQSIESDLNYISSNWDIKNESYVISSHRKILGPFLVKGRSLVHGEVRRYVDPIFWKQREFNASVVRILNKIVEIIDKSTSKKWINEHEEKYYYLFEEKHRGSRDLIKERFRRHLKYFEGCKNVLDIGCGRGEFLELLRESGVSARGIDINEDMVKYCQSRGLDVVKADAIEYLESLENKSLDGIFIAQVVEHLEPRYLVELLKLCYRKLKFGYYIVVESVNPLSLASLMNFYVDLTHKRPIHPETMKFLLEYVGFRDIRVEFYEELPDNIKLAKIETDSFSEELRRFIEVYNQNIDKLNSIVFGAQDYAVIGKKIKIEP